MEKQLARKCTYSPWGIFEAACNRYPDQPMFIHNDIRLTYREIDHVTRRIGEYIRGFDFRIYGLYLPNSIDFISFLLALNHEKKIIVPLSYQLKGDSLFERLNYADVEAVITDKNGFEELLKLKERLNTHVIVQKGQDEYDLHQFGLKPKPTTGIHDDVFGICFTSGSTSRPKGVLINNGAIAGNAAAVADFLQMEHHDVFLVTRSFAQAGPIAGDILMTISHGGCIVISNDLFHPSVFLKTVQLYKVTTTLLINTMLAMVLDSSQLGNYDLSSLKRVIFGGMVVSRNMVHQAIQKMPGVDFYCTYGLTEASTRVCFTNPSDLIRYPGSSGKPIRGCQVKIYKENGMEAKVNETGEIYIVSDYVMDGYYKYPELTAGSLTPQGLRTKDIGYRNENGLLYVCGRSDDLIIQGGNNVFPIEIEEVLLRNPHIKEAAVFGIEDPILGQKIVALVSLNDGNAIDAQEVHRWCRANLEDRKVPKETHVWDHIPKTELGKINKNELKKILLDKARVS
jgi:acyl-CoA synthetase (AMP-forming)/AMP-acid ligase II